LLIDGYLLLFVIILIESLLVTIIRCFVSDKVFYEEVYEWLVFSLVLGYHRSNNWKHVIVGTIGESRCVVRSLDLLVLSIELLLLVMCFTCQGS
jgi:hypothetical protein